MGFNGNVWDFMGFIRNGNDVYTLPLEMAIEIVSFPMKSMVIFRFVM